VGAWKAHCWLAADPMYFGSVRKVAFPFKEFEEASRFVALVKFYFLLGHRAGLYTTNPGFTMSKSWRQDLYDACDDIIKAEARIAREEQEKKRRERPEQTLSQAESTTKPSPTSALHLTQPPPLALPRLKHSQAPRDSLDDMRPGKITDDSDEREEHADRVSPRDSSRDSANPPYHGTPSAPVHYLQQPNSYLYANMPPPPGFHPSKPQPPDGRFGADPYESPDDMLRRISEHPSARNRSTRPMTLRRNISQSASRTRNDSSAPEQSRNKLQAPRKTSGADSGLRRSMSHTQLDQAAM
jgi:hypothetical protein